MICTRLVPGVRRPTRQPLFFAGTVSTHTTRRGTATPPRSSGAAASERAAPTARTQTVPWEIFSTIPNSHQTSTKAGFVGLERGVR
eukprot:465014-Rhodomonas_salina.1